VTKTTGRGRDLSGHLHPGQAGHADVQKDDLRSMLLDKFNGLSAVPGLSANDQLGPDLGKLDFRYLRSCSSSSAMRALIFFIV